MKKPTTIFPPVGPVLRYKGLRKAFDQVRKMDREQIRAELCQALGIEPRTLDNHIYGRVRTSAEQAAIITTVFARYKIRDIWDE